MANTIPAATNKIRLNDQNYEMGLSLFNPQGTGIMFPINTAALVQLVIEEDGREWFKRGHLIVNNHDNSIERRPNEYINAASLYKFRNDGRDMLLVNIKPVIDGVSLANDPFQSDGWEMNYVFAIYDIEDIPGDTPKDKKIKMYFWEFDYQLFAETASVYSSNSTLYRLHPSLTGLTSVLDDETRKAPTGECIKDLIKQILNVRSQPQKFRSDWDAGASKIFYSSPVAFSAVDDIDYLFNRHTASGQFGGVKGDVPLLYRTRSNKTWCLTSLAAELSYACAGNEAGSLQIEQFFITDTDTDGIQVPSLYKTPQSSKVDRNLNLGHKSVINNFRFVDMAAMDNIFALIDSPTSSNDIQNRLFSVDVAETAIENIKIYFQNNYVNKFTNNQNPTAAFTVNKSKKDSFMYKQDYSYGTTSIDRYPDGRNIALKTAFFLNQCVNFNVLGSTLRRASSFIGIDRQTGSIDADFDEKLLGQWYVIVCRHTFTQTSYTNNITAVKPHFDKDIRIGEDVT